MLPSESSRAIAKRAEQHQADAQQAQFDRKMQLLELLEYASDKNTDAEATTVTLLALAQHWDLSHDVKVLVSNHAAST